jgi:hypothetical protein
MSNYGALSQTMTQLTALVQQPIEIYSVGIIRDTNLDNCLSFDGQNINLRRCPVALTEFNDTFRFKFTNGEVHDVNSKYCFTRNNNSEFNFEKIKTYDSWSNNCYKFNKEANFPIKSDNGTCLGNNIDKVMSIPCNVSNWKMTMNTL